MSAGRGLRRRVIRWAAVLAPLLAALSYGAAVALAKANPPLALCGGASNQIGETHLVGKRLCNFGKWNVTIEKIAVENPEADVFIVSTARQGSSILLPESVAADPGSSAHEPFDSGKGLVIAPDRPVPDVLYGVRIETWKEFVGQQVLVVRYRYLGWPMTLRAPLE